MHKQQKNISLFLSSGGVRGLDIRSISWSSIDAKQSTIDSFKLATYSLNLVIEKPKDICTVYECVRAKDLRGVGHREEEKLLDVVSLTQ